MTFPRRSAALPRRASASSPRRLRFGFLPVVRRNIFVETMTRSWQSQSFIPAFQSILGDPTLRLFRVTPPQNVRSSRPVMNGPVTLTWDPAAEAGTAYYLYRSASGVDGFAATPNPLNVVRVQGTSFTDTAASGANLTYQVRATKLQTTGSGSFWNLSQGAFITVP